MEGDTTYSYLEYNSFVEAKYNIQSFLRDLPNIRKKSFKQQTIRHTFKNTSIFPISFKQVEKKFTKYVKGGRLRYSKNLRVDIYEYFYSSPPPSLLLSLLLIDNILVLKYNLYQLFNSLPPPIDYNKID